MPEIPACLHRRYRALDELIKDLSSSMSNRSSMSECTVECANDPGVKLMCDFWNILKEHPDCNLKAASFGKNCCAGVNDLMAAQTNLKEQIKQLEEREKNGVILLKQADCMWACMEDAYKKKIAESLERQEVILKELKAIEANATKWRKNKKELEFQTNNVIKCQQEITEKINQKINDKKCLEAEIADFNKRINNNKKDLEAAKNIISNKKQNSDAKIATIAGEIKKNKKTLQEVQKYKQDKEIEGKNYIKEAREDLQKICSLLLQKKLENEDLKAEREALILEIEMLKQACGECRGNCKNKKQAVLDEIKTLDAEIAKFTVKCIKCHECVDTSDVRKLCTDCPRCVGDRECLYEDGQCTPDPTADCVCMSVKQKFLDNVFDNMYTVLEKEANSRPGKVVAEAVLKCLKKSKNGKLNTETKQILQEFILSTVKKNLNLTIVSGAVKTRCEMDAETYQQLMLCLKEVKVTRPPKVDKGTIAKKEACPRWGSSSECNCPKGPKACVCTKNVEEIADDPAPADSEDKRKAQRTYNNKDQATCNPHYTLHVQPNLVSTEVASRPHSSCKGSLCPLPKNMRAAQCILGPDSLSLIPKSKTTPRPILDLDSQISCTCGNSPMKLYNCSENNKIRPRDHIIQEVMGGYSEVTPIEKVKNISEHYNRKSKGRNIVTGYNSHQKLKKSDMALKIFKNQGSHYCTCSKMCSAKDNNNIVKSLSSELNTLSTGRRNKDLCSSDEIFTYPINNKYFDSSPEKLLLLL